MIHYGYSIYQAERPLTRTEQRAADARLGRRCAALARWRQSLVSRASALRLAPGASPAGGRACAPADGELMIRTGP